MNKDLTLSRLQDNGHRITRVRKDMIEIFSTSTVPLSASQIQTRLSQDGLTTNKATIYRELQFLLQNGYLSEVNLHSNEVSYESSELTHHHHLVCDTCGEVDNVTNCLAEKLEDDVLKKKGFRILRHSLEFYGTCAKCARKVA